MRWSLSLLALFLSSQLLAADWPAFRGPEGNGVSTEKQAPLQWSKNKNLKWRTALPRPGNGSPIVSNGVVFVTSAEDEQGHERSLYAFDRQTGDKLWAKTVRYEKDDPTHDTNPYGGSTPASDGKYVVVWHSSAGLYCYDFAGNELWGKDLGEFRHMWGYGTSPVIYKDRVILHTGPGKNAFVAAYALADGQQMWKTGEPLDGNGERRASDNAYMGSWCTPLITKLGGKMQAICTQPTRVVGYDLEDGKILWWCDGIRGPKGDLAYSSPVVAGDVCVAVGGFNGPAIGFKLGGAGDITADRLWRKDSTPQSIGSGVAIDGYFYRPNAGPGTIDCIDPRTGDIKWTERTGTFWGSIVHVDGRCYATAQDGTTFVFKPSPEKYESLAKNPLGEPSNATPALSNGEFFLRTHKALYCIGE